MTDLSALSDQELQALYQPQQTAVEGNPTRITVRPAGAIDLSKLSDADLIATHGSLGGTIADVAKSAGIGLAKGAIGLAGLPGDLTELGARGIDYAARGVGNLIGQDIAPRPQQEPMLGSAQLQRGVESLTGPLYEPKTTAGHYAQTAGEFLPALIGGPETLAAKFATRVAAPAVASESAGQLTKGTAAEPFARLAGAVTGGVGAARALAPSAIAAPNAAQLAASSRAGYNHPIVKAVQINPASTASLYADIRNGLHAEQFDKDIAPFTFSTIAKLTRPVGPTSTIADIKNTRTMLGKIAKSGMGSPDSAAAQASIAKINKYLDGIGAPDVLAGDAGAANAILKQANSDYRARKSLEQVNEALAKAQRQASRSHSGTNIDNATRQKISSILDNPSRAKFFTADEKQQMQKIIDGTFTGNLSRKLGKILATTGMHGAAVVGTSAAFALPTHGLSLAAPALGYLGKTLGNHITASSAAELQRRIGMNSDLGRSLPPIAPSTKPLNVGLLSGLLELQHRQ